MIPSPITWLTVPSYRCTASIMCSRTGSRSLRASSGSRSASSSIDPLRSANRTVTCLRSPSKAALEVRIFSARCLGVYESGAANLAVGFVRSGAAHWPQNLFSGGLAAPQDGQVAARGEAHSPQNFMPVGFSWWHRGHCIPRPPSEPGRERSDRWRELMLVGPEGSRRARADASRTDSYAVSGRHVPLLGGVRKSVTVTWRSVAYLNLALLRLECATLAPLEPVRSRRLP